MNGSIRRGAAAAVICLISALGLLTAIVGGPAAPAGMSGTSPSLSSPQAAVPGSGQADPRIDHASGGHADAAVRPAPPRAVRTGITERTAGGHPGWVAPPAALWAIALLALLAGTHRCGWLQLSAAKGNRAAPRAPPCAVPA